MKNAKQFIFFLIFNFLISGIINGHPWKPDHYVIIDTDCGLDDFRAINLMLASSNIRVLAIITSNGVLNADDGYFKVKDLLRNNYNDGILVGANQNLLSHARDCKAAIDFSWGNENDQYQMDMVLYSDVLNQVFQNCNEKIVFVNMGSLNTINSYLMNNPLQIDQIKEIIWTCNYEKLTESFNYLIDTTSYHSINEKNVPIEYINGNSFGEYNSILIREISDLNSKFTDNFYKSLTISNSPFSKSLYDESSVLYLLKKELFFVDTISPGIYVYNLKSDVNLKDEIINILSNKSKNQNQVLLKFSTDTADYISDVQLIMESTIKNYGEEEWVACVLTSELHRHLGVYSLIGAKMGIRAREFFGVGVDELKIVSYAGLNPPFSCLNDGLQVSTGATLGHGLITVKDSLKLIKADFIYLGQKITISLKEEYRNKIISEIKELSFIYGLDSNIYWDLVRNLALQYWENWDRHDIFEIGVK